MRATLPLVVGQPYGGCFARLANHDGTMSFDAPQRKYFHWAERLNEMGSPLGDTTRVRRTWTFETSAGVRSFSFNVLIAAALDTSLPRTFATRRARIRYA